MAENILSQGPPQEKREGARPPRAGAQTGPYRSVPSTQHRREVGCYIWRGADRESPDLIRRAARHTYAVCRAVGRRVRVHVPGRPRQVPASEARNQRTVNVQSTYSQHTVNIQSTSSQHTVNMIVILVEMYSFAIVLAHGAAD